MSTGSVLRSKEATGEATKRSAQSRAFSGASCAPGGQPSVSFTTLGPFGGGRVSLRAWPKVRADLESGVARFRICAYVAHLDGDLC